MLSLTVKLYIYRSEFCQFQEVQTEEFLLEAFEVQWKYQVSIKAKPQPPINKTEFHFVHILNSKVKKYVVMEGKMNLKNIKFYSWVVRLMMERTNWGDWDTENGGIEWRDRWRLQSWTRTHNYKDEVLFTIFI